MKRGIITVIIIAAALGGIYFILNKNKAKNDAITSEAAKSNAFVAVRVDTARMEVMNLEYAANGTFLPKQEVVIGSETAGRVVKVLVEEGAYVSAGQTLAVVKADKLDVNVANAEANYDNAKHNLDRFESAYKTGGVTSQQLDQARLQFETAKNNLKTSKLTAGDATIKSSVAGIVNSRKIEPGTYVNPGTAAFDIVNVSSLKLRVLVDEKHVVGLNVGQTVSVKASVYPNKSYVGKIVFIAPKADGSLNFPVEIEVTNLNNELRAGMYGTAVFGGDSAPSNVLIVPRTAFVGSVSDNKIFVAKGGKAVETKVVSGRNFGDKIEVISGLNTNDQVVISGQINLLDQTAIEIIK